MGSTKVQAAPAPAPRNLGQEYRETLEAKIEMTPEILKLQEEYGDDFTKIDLRQLSNALGGVDGQPGILEIYKQVMPVLSETEAEAQRAQTDSRLTAYPIHTPGKSPKALGPASQPGGWLCRPIQQSMRPR